MAETSGSKHFSGRGCLAACVLALVALLPLDGCQSSSDSTPQTAQDTLPSPPVRSPAPSRDEAANLIKVCGRPDSDTRKAAPSGAAGAVRRIMKWKRYDVEVWLDHNDVDSPRWATTGIFLINGDDAIDRETLSKKMPCSRRTTVYFVDGLFQ
jgi:hypothetical protein